MKSLNEVRQTEYTKIFGKYRMHKDRPIIPLGVKGSDVGIERDREMSKVTVGVGLRVQSYIQSFPYDYFDLILLDGEIQLYLTVKGKKAIKVRDKSVPNYLDSVIKGFQRALNEYFNR